MREYKDFAMTHSAKKSYDERGICKLKWRAHWITKEIPRDEPSEQMIKGVYFETMAFGSNSGGDEIPDISFLYDSKGNPRVELTRIHEQVDRFKELFDENHPDFLGFNIKETQLTLKDENTNTKGIIDFIAENEFLQPCVFDVKFTADADNDRGDYAWGRNPEDIDWSQQKLYSHLYEHNFGVKPKMYVIVFDASPKKNIRLFEINISNMSVDSILNEYDVMRHELDYYEQSGWPTNPTEKNCGSCPLECELRYVSPVVKKIKVSV